MGTFLSIHRDVQRSIFSKYLNKYDRIVFLWSVGVKIRPERAFFCNAVRNGYINLMTWIERGREEEIKEWIGRRWEDQTLLKRDPEEPVKFHAVKGDRADVLEWLYTRDVSCLRGVYEYAAETGSLETLKWLKTKQNIYFYFLDVAIGAINYGHLKILIWIKEEYPNIWEGWKYQYGHGMEYDNLTGLAFECGQFEIFKFLEEDSDFALTLSIFRNYQAIIDDINRKGVLEIVNYLKTKYEAF